MEKIKKSRWRKESFRRGPSGYAVPLSGYRFEQYICNSIFSRFSTLLSAECSSERVAIIINLPLSRCPRCYSRH